MKKKNKIFGVKIDLGGKIKTKFSLSHSSSSKTLLACGVIM